MKSRHSQKNHRLKSIALSVLLCFAAPMVQAADDKISTQQLETVKVKGKRNRAQQGAAVERKNREALATEMIQTNKDLVRYSVDVGVTDQGRHSKGFAMRGVDDNRVGVSIDGVSMPDSEENSLYKRYNNLNTSRQSIDPELARSVDINKGADSFNQGSGHLGGGVNYRTVEAADIVQPENHFGAMLRSGYGSRNREWVNTLAGAYQNEQLQAVLLYSHRRGHENKSAGGYTLPEEPLMRRERGYSRQIPDPSSHRHHSYLGKLSYAFNENHRVGVTYSGQRKKNHIIEESALTNANRWRSADDIANRDTTNVFYEYTPDSKWLSLFKLDGDYQKTETTAHNYEGTRVDNKTDDVDFRIFKTDFKRLNTRLDSATFNLTGTQHKLSLKAHLAERLFEIQHQDHNPPSTKINYETTSYPIKTKQFGVSLLDNIRINKILSGQLGVRYDQSTHSQQALREGYVCRNCLKNGDAKFRGWTWTAGLNAQVTPAWNVGYHVGTGFRVPSSSEMYFDFRSQSGNWLANPNLKAERSLSQNFNITGNGKYGSLNLNLHHTKYKDFLFEQETYEETTPFQQMQNLSHAKVRGVEATGKLDLHHLARGHLPEGLKLMGSVGYNKGNMSNGADILAIQPIKSVVGLDYEPSHGKWGVFSRFTYLGEKKAKDAEYQSGQYNDTVVLSTWKHRNGKALVVDTFGFYKLNNHLTLRAGVYNIFNRKYHTWDSMRGLNSTGGIANSVTRTGDPVFGGYPGLQRYYEPGRNYAVSVEYKF